MSTTQQSEPATEQSVHGQIESTLREMFYGDDIMAPYMSAWEFSVRGIGLSGKDYFRRLDELLNLLSHMRDSNPQQSNRV